MSSKCTDLTGRVFGRLTVIERLDYSSKDRRWNWRCLCSCGKEKIASSKMLMGGQLKSCRCLLYEGKPKHGMTKSGTYRSWIAMKKRCEPQSKDAHIYFKKGIFVCERWLHSFETFLSDMGERPDGTSLDRVDNSKGYYPDNCRWASPSVQSRNRDDNIWVDFNGEKRTLIDLCEIHKKNIVTVKGRIKRGWALEDALRKPVETKNHPKASLSKNRSVSLLGSKWVLARRDEA